MRVAIFSHNARSPYTAALAWQLARDGHSVCAIVVRTRLDWPRSQRAWSRSARRALAGLLRKSLPVKDAAAPEYSLTDYCHSHAVPHGLAVLARRIGASLVHCQSFTAAHVLRSLRAQALDMGFHTGAGSLRPAVLEACGQGVVRCHVGALPQLRGSDGLAWSLLSGTPCVLTCHWLDSGVDTGGVILQRPVPQRPGDSLARLRVRVPPLQVEALRAAALGLRDKSLHTAPQDLLAGRQHYAMHPRLRALLER